jgi:recombination protein RecT
MTTEVATKPRQTAADVFYDDLETYTPNLRDALPADIPVERFKRVLVTAVSQNPELLYADRRTLFNAAVKCAVDGLIPDGRLAALVVFRTDVKQRDPNTGLDHWRKIDAVQYMPMVAGLRERMRKSGEVASATAEAVFENDRFSYRLGDEPYIQHEPPALGVPRGKVVGAYAIIRLRNGEVIRDVMDRDTIEAARKKGRGADKSLMWTEFYWEGAKKTVLRRAAKQAPFSSEMRRVLDRDEEEPEIGPDLHPGIAKQNAALQEPRVMPRIEAEDSGPEFAVVDLDGVEHLYGNAGLAGAAMQVCLDEAALIGPDRVEGWWEDNRSAVEFLRAAGFRQAADEVTRAYEERKAKPAPRKVPRMIEEDGYVGSLVPAPEEEPEHFIPPEPPPPAEPPRRAAPTPKLEIAVPKKNGKEDWSTWARALLAPKVRRCASSNDLADLLGANERNLEGARAAGSLAKAELDEMEKLIADQWQKVPA